MSNFKSLDYGSLAQKWSLAVIVLMLFGLLPNQGKHEVQLCLLLLLFADSVQTMIGLNLV